MTAAESLEANENLSNRGFSTWQRRIHRRAGRSWTRSGQHRDGFCTVTCKPYRNGRDLTAKPRGVYVIDLFGLTDDEARRLLPEVHQHVLTHVKPDRET